MSGRSGRGRPRIVVVTRRYHRKNKWVDFVGEHHLEALISLGALPVLVPVVEGTPAALRDYAGGMAGLLLVEGEDIGPDRYDPPSAHRRLIKAPHPLKDEIEFRLCRLALKQRVPILGICRGCQVLNVICGGTLHCDVMQEKGTSLAHIGDEAHYDTYRHPLTILPDTPLHRWYRRDRINATSYHHQGIKKLARCFRPMAHSDDGLIEGFYDPSMPFRIGLQFHPERMFKDYPGNRRVFDAFIHAAADVPRR